MRAYIFIVLCVHFVHAVTYRAGVINSFELSDIVRNVNEAGKKNVDVLVVSSDIIGSEDNYETIVKDLSKAARNAELYLIANLKEKIKCQSISEVVRSNHVFDRKGDIVSVYRKPACVTNSTSALTTFASDFGVTFGLMMEEDLVMKNDDELEGVKHFIVVGQWNSDVTFLSASQFLPSWAFVHGANVISDGGIYSSEGPFTALKGKLLISEVRKDGAASASPPVLPQNSPGEDLGQFIIRPLDMEAASRGHHQVLCHNAFCCSFQIKTNVRGSPQSDINYGLAVFDGIRHYGSKQYIGTQNCAIFACAGLYKRSCSFGSVNNNTDVVFEKLTISANFTKYNSIQYPVILSNDIVFSENFNFLTKNTKSAKEVTVTLKNNNNLLSFGIFGRVFRDDYKMPEDNNFGVYDYIFNDDVIEFFDYIWIRLRILIFIVSIYFLEMM